MYTTVHARGWLSTHPPMPNSHNGGLSYKESHSYINNNIIFMHLLSSPLKQFDDETDRTSI